jgi:hypothetical protein
VGKIAEHTTEREDKTTAVVDKDAKVKNLTAFRDSLRGMLARPSATVKDLVEIQKQLSDTLSELDSQTAQGKILANETEKISIEISFRVERPADSKGGLRQVWEAFKECGDIFSESLAALITTIAAVIPWLVLIVPGVWYLRRTWKAWRSRRNRTAAPTAQTAG